MSAALGYIYSSNYFVFIYNCFDLCILLNLLFIIILRIVYKKFKTLEENVNILYGMLESTVKLENVN